MKRKIIFGLSIILTLMTGCAEKEADTYQNAFRAIEMGDYDTATSLFNKALSEGADARLVYRGEGIAYLGLNDYETAAKSFENALALSNGIINSDDMDISMYLAVAFYKSGNIDEALKTLDSILAIDPKNDKAYYMRGKINLIGGNKNGAIEDYDKAISIAPNDYDHYIRMCEDLREAGFTEDSDAYIEKAMSSGGKMTDYRKGVFEYYLGYYTDARNDLEKARKSENTENLLLYLGRTYEALGDTGYALNIYEEAVTANPNNSKVYNQLALLMIDQKDYQGALDMINQALESGDGEAKQSLMFNRVVATESLYDFKKAAQYMNEYLAEYPNDEVAKREYVFLKTR